LELSKILQSCPPQLLLDLVCGVLREPLVLEDLLRRGPVIHIPDEALAYEIFGAIRDGTPQAFREDEGLLTDCLEGFLIRLAQEGRPG